MSVSRLLFSIFLIKFSYAQGTLKLPDSIKPEHYSIKILTILDALKFEGYVDILVKCYVPTKDITLHAAEIIVKEEEVSVEDVGTAIKLRIKEIKRVENENFLNISMQDNLQRNNKYNIQIKFEGVLQLENPRGFYINTYLDEEGTTHTIANTHFEPIWARNAFPCFDLPHMKATFEVTIGRNGKYSSLNNMPLARTEPIKGRDGWFWDHFEKTPTMSTYLVAFAVLDDGMKNFSSGNINFWIPPLSKLPRDFVLEKVPKILHLLEQYFGMEYELPKLDILVVNNIPFFSGACENWGLVVVCEAAFSETDYYPEVTTKIIVHELVHQWIGNIITMKCFGELWLKEGITTYVGTIFTDVVFDGQTIDIDRAGSFIETMSSYFSQGISVENCPEHLDDILMHYIQNTYTKGGLFTRMIQLTFGMEDFKKPMNLLLTKHKFQNFDENDLSKALEETIPHGNFPSNLHLDIVLKSWTKQNGFPLVEVTRNYKTGTATITQRKFYYTDPKDEELSCWWIPISYTTRSGHVTNNTVAENWLRCPREPLTIRNLNSSDWILANLQSTGLFIVKYDDDNWNLLNQTLRDKNSFEIIPYWNRFRLILDSLILTDFGLISHESLLTTLLYLKHETNYIVWMAALKYLAKIEWLEVDVVRLKDKYVRQLVKPHFSKQLFDLKSSSLGAVKFRREIIRQACLSGDNSCIKECLRIFEEFKNSFPKNSSLDKNLRGVVFCIVVQFGAEKDKQFLIDILPQTEDVVLSAQINEGLSCSETPLPQQEMRKLSTRGHSTEELSNMMKSFKKRDKRSQIDALENLLEKPYSAATIIDHLSMISHQFHDPLLLTAFKTFFEKNKEILIRHKKTTNEILERMKRNIEWKKKYSGEIKTALSSVLREKEEDSDIFQTYSILSTTPLISEGRPKVKKPAISKSYGLHSVINWPIGISMCLIVIYFK